LTDDFSTHDLLKEEIGTNVLPIFSLFTVSNRSLPRSLLWVREYALICAFLSFRGWWKDRSTISTKRKTALSLL